VSQCCRVVRPLRPGLEVPRVRAALRPGVTEMQGYTQTGAAIGGSTPGPCIPYTGRRQRTGPARRSGGGRRRNARPSGLPMCPTSRGHACNALSDERTVPLCRPQSCDRASRMIRGLRTGGEHTEASERLARVSFGGEGPRQRERRLEPWGVWPVTVLVGQTYLAGAVHAVVSGSCDASRSVAHVTSPTCHRDRHAAN